jgi:hypothetical protein
VFVNFCFETHLYFQLPTMRLIGDICVPVFKMPYPSSDTASVHTGFSISTLKSRLFIRCRNFLLDEKLCHNTLPEWHVHAAVLSNWNTTAWWGQVIGILLWCEMIDGISCHILRHTILRGAIYMCILSIFYRQEDVYSSALLSTNTKSHVLVFVFGLLRH